MSDTPITITFQASRELHGWLAARAAARESSLGAFVRGLCVEARDRVAVTFGEPTTPHTNGVLTVKQAKRRAAVRR